MKKHLRGTVTSIPKIIFTLIFLVMLLLKPENATEGIKNGISLLLTTIIPSLFPFMVLSSYIASAESFRLLSEKLGTTTEKVFKINSDGFIPIIMGLFGGYPIGAKVTSDLYKANRLTHNEAERLLYFCVNSGPAFTISAVGLGMLNNYRQGVILFFSNIATALVMGFLCRFLNDGTSPECHSAKRESNSFTFINSVTSGADAIINISSWVLIFSCFSGILNSFNLSEELTLFLNAITEVTNGLKLCCQNASLPVISAILGFGGFSVICQVSPFITACNVKMKNFITSRILNSAISAFFTFQATRLFPSAEKAAVIYSEKGLTLETSYTLSASLILLIMCMIFILQVDNRKKIC